MMNFLTTTLMVVFGSAALVAYTACASAGRADTAAGWKDAP